MKRKFFASTRLRQFYIDKMHDDDIEVFFYEDVDDLSKVIPTFEIYYSKEYDDGFKREKAIIFLNIDYKNLDSLIKSFTYKSYAIDTFLNYEKSIKKNLYKELSLINDPHQRKLRKKEFKNNLKLIRRQFVKDYCNSLWGKNSSINRNLIEYCYLPDFIIDIVYSKIFFGYDPITYNVFYKFVDEFQ